MADHEPLNCWPRVQFVCVAISRRVSKVPIAISAAPLTVFCSKPARDKPRAIIRTLNLRFIYSTLTATSTNLNPIFRPLSVLSHPCT